MRFGAWLFGPELYWLVAYGVSRVVANRTVPRDPGSILLLERLTWLVPLITVPLSFAIFYWLMPLYTARGWLTARNVMATFVGLNACLIVIIDAIDYGNSRNAGVLGFWVFGGMLGGVLWIAGYIVVLVTNARGRLV